MSSAKNYTPLIAVLSFVVLLVCCVGPAALFVFNYGSAQQRVQALINTAAGITPTVRPAAAPAGPLPTFPRPGPTATLEAGWKLYTMPKDGFAIAYPPSWMYQETDPATLQPAIAALKKNNPQMANLLESRQGQIATAGVKYYAIDTGPNSSTGGLITNSNLIHESVNQVYTLDYFVGMSIKQLEDATTMVSKPINHRRLQFPAGEAEEVRYLLNMVNESKQTIKLSTIQYLFLNGKETYTLTFSVSTSLEARYLPAFEKIARTFRYTGY